MKTVHVSASTEYDVLIGGGLLEKAGELCRKKNGGGRAAIIADSTVGGLYLDKVLKSFSKAGIKAVSFVFPAGEQSKNKDVLFEIIGFFAENALGSSDFAVALGGGVTGDLTGLASALYRRGFPFVQLPTTLLAAVDSSVGGKTAVNISRGKNLAGVFHQPSLVICDTDTLKTLPDGELACGMAEVIKYGVLFDEKLFESVENGGMSLPEETIAECVELKSRCVAADEFDRGERRLLNLGHSFGHAAELLSGYEMPHGFAVAVGTVKAAECSAALGLCEKETPERIKRALENNGLPTEWKFSREEISAAMINDKKQNGGRISLILPERIGRCFIHETDITAI